MYYLSSTSYIILVIKHDLSYEVLNLITKIDF